MARQIDRQKDRQIDRQTDRQIDRSRTGPQNVLSLILRRARQPLRSLSTDMLGPNALASLAARTPGTLSRSCTSCKRSMEIAAAASSSCASCIAAASVARMGPANVLLPFLRRARQPSPLFCTGMIYAKRQSGKLRTSNFCTRRVKAARSKCNLSHVLSLDAVLTLIRSLLHTACQSFRNCTMLFAGSAVVLVYCLI